MKKRRRMTEEERELEWLKLFGSRERIESRDGEIPEKDPGRIRKAEHDKEEEVKECSEGENGRDSCL